MKQAAWLFFPGLLGALLGAAGCGRARETGAAGAAGGCSPLEGSPWVPAVTSGVPAAASGVEQLVLNASGAVSGFGSEPIPLEFEIPMTGDLGRGGSLSLIAEVSGAEAYPVLLSVHDGTRELVGLARTGSGGCATPGLFCCTEGADCFNERWTIAAESMFAGRAHWEQYQFNAFGPLSVNVFPTCDWAEGEPRCVLADPMLFPGHQLRFGSPYRVRYALISPLRAPGGEARLKLTVLKKKRVSLAGSGVLDFNFVLVGSKNVAASRTSRGRRNLDALVARVADYYAPARIGIGSVRAVEWGCEDGGDAFAQLRLEELPTLFRVGSSRAAQPGRRAVNLFLVSSIQDDEAGSGMTLLGISGGILGPMLDGTPASGVAFSSFDKLDIYNPRCEADDCPPALQQRDFAEIGVTLAHELGHFLGLNHPSEGTGLRHDYLPDTPTCTQTESLPIGRLITTRSCWEGEAACRVACPNYNGRTVFCPAREECQFNHLMWWTSKNFASGQGDGNLLSRDSVAILHFNPFVKE
ncbi:MAG: M43 family zinc metalloprotease [Oligoflexia bacterium]|nr:M43 family zinc metalloprotease [Oligoflexia bacterium]